MNLWFGLIDIGFFLNDVIWRWTDLSLRWRHGNRTGSWMVHGDTTIDGSRILKGFWVNYGSASLELFVLLIEWRRTLAGTDMVV